MAKTKKKKGTPFAELVKKKHRGRSLGFARDKVRKEQRERNA